MSGLYNQLQKIQRSMLEQSVQDDLSSVAQNTSQLNTIASLYLAPTGNATTDTANLQSCSGKTVILGSGTFIVNQPITWGLNTNVTGTGMGKTIIQLANGANCSVIVMQDAKWSSIHKITIDGNRANNGSTPLSNTTAGLLFTTTITGNNNDKSAYSEIEIKNCASNGMSVTGYIAGTRLTSWAILFNTFHIYDCTGYCFYDSSTDNRYSDFYISHGSQAGILCDGAGSNMYSNFKTDGISGDANSGDNTIQTSGSNIIIRNCTNIIFSNLDCQSGGFAGMKIFNSYEVQIYANFDSNGQRNPTSISTGLYISGSSSNIVGNVHFWTTNSNYQQTDLYIDPSCSNISLTSETITTSKIKNSGYNCTISSIRKVGQDSSHNKSLINGFFKAYATGSATQTGFNNAINKGLVGSNLITWLEGSNFPTSQSAWTDGSGFGNNVTPTNMAFTTSSGADGAGGVNFDNVDDYVVSSVPPSTANLNLSSTNPLTIQVTFTPPSGITSGTGFLGTIKNYTSGNYARWSLSLNATNCYVTMWDNLNAQNSFSPSSAPTYSAGTQITITAVLEQINNAIFCTYYKNGIYVSRIVWNYTGAGNFNGIGNFAIQGLYGSGGAVNVKRVRVYNMALTADEVLQNYNSGN